MNNSRPTQESGDPDFGATEAINANAGSQNDSSEAISSTVDTDKAARDTQVGNTAPTRSCALSANAAAAAAKPYVAASPISHEATQPLDDVPSSQVEHSRRPGAPIPPGSYSPKLDGNQSLQDGFAAYSNGAPTEPMSPAAEDLHAKHIQDQQAARDHLSATAPIPPAGMPHTHRAYAQHQAHQGEHGPNPQKKAHAPQDPERKKLIRTASMYGALSGLVVTILYFILASLMGGFGYHFVSLGSEPSVIAAQGEDVDLAEVVAQKSLPSVVGIDVYKTPAQNPFRGFGGGQGDADTLEQSSLGSGVIISSDGYVLTNDHVVEGGEKFSVSTSDGEHHDARLVGQDPSSDIAVLKIEGEFEAIDLGSSADLTVGEWVMTIGSPYGLEQSVATGIVSATSRSSVLESEAGTAYYINMIQTEAINPGNSGGALVDKNGKLIGINTMITSQSGGYSGVGFAIPVDYALGIAKDLIDGKTPTRAQLGVTVVTVNKQVAAQFNLSSDFGAYVNSVTEDSAADNAGIEVGDIITKCNGKRINSASDLVLAIRSINPGDSLTLEINRDGSIEEIDAVLDASGAHLQIQMPQKQEKKKLFD